LEILDLLATNFAAVEAKFLDCPSRLARRTNCLLGTELNSGDRRLPEPEIHPTVVKALAYIEEHLSEPKLTVSRIAREIGYHRSYLSSLFKKCCGQRMNRFIAERRAEAAKRILATTDWQIKRIAYETGHANANWFACAFHKVTGMTPAEYRAQSLCADRT